MVESNYYSMFEEADYQDDIKLRIFISKHKKEINELIRSKFHSEIEKIDLIAISGTNIGLPGKDSSVFSPDNWNKLISSLNLIDEISLPQREKFLDKNITYPLKNSSIEEKVDSLEKVLKLAGQLGKFDLIKEYGVPEKLVNSMDITFQLSLASTLEALKEAKIPLVPPTCSLKNSENDFNPFKLPEEMRKRTSVIFTSAFPGFNSVVKEVSDYLTSKFLKNGVKIIKEFENFYEKVIDKIEDKNHKEEITKWYIETLKKFNDLGYSKDEEKVYKFNRKFLFKVTASFGASQISQFIGAKGLSIQTNNACASGAYAKWLGRKLLLDNDADLVIVTGADNITSEYMLEYWGGGFLSIGATTIEGDIEKAAKPFDINRNGMILSAGVGTIILEKSSSIKKRGMNPYGYLLSAKVGNSAYHGTRLNPAHISSLLDELLKEVEKEYGFTRTELAQEMVFLSHESYTPSYGKSAQAEIESLKNNFGENANKIIISNINGITGHFMGAPIEDVASIKILETGIIPPVVNLTTPEPEFSSMRFSKGEKLPVRFVLRFAAGFGSQVAFTLEMKSNNGGKIFDENLYNSFLKEISGTDNPTVEVVKNIYKIKDETSVKLNENETFKDETSVKLEEEDKKKN